MPCLLANSLRPAAVGMLMAFTGAAWGFLHYLQAFSGNVGGCYRTGQAPQQLFNVLGPQKLDQVPATNIQQIVCAFLFPGTKSVVFAVSLCLQ